MRFALFYLSTQASTSTNLRTTRLAFMQISQIELGGLLDSRFLCRLNLPWANHLRMTGLIHDSLLVPSVRFCPMSGVAFPSKKSAALLV
jgi:hypothetical protein